MGLLCTRQQQQVRDLVEIAAGGREYLPPTLLLGQSGAGKRTVCKAAAISLGFRFIEVPLAGSADSIRESLFGTPGQASQAAVNALPPGEAGAGEPTLLYLSALHRMDPAVANELHRLVTRRRYVDAIGTVWTLSPDVWVVGAYGIGVRITSIDIDHFLPAAFERRYQVNRPRTQEDLQHICESICSQIRPGVNLSSDAVQYLSALAAGAGGLHAVRRLIESASLAIQRGASITAQTLHDAALQDLEWSLGGIRYRGTALTAKSLAAWLEQFPQNLRPVATDLFRTIVDKYYISDDAFHHLIGELVRRSGVKSNSRVVFCRWQYMGGSANRVANELKNRGGWRVEHEIDLSKPGSWGRLRTDTQYLFVIADDFVGSGNQMAPLLNQHQGAVVRLLSRFPNSRIQFLLMLGYESGLRRAVSVARNSSRRVGVIVGRVLDDSDRCFTPTSSIVSNEQRQPLRQFCLSMAAERMPNLRSSLRLGYGGTASVVVFGDSVPNNTLPIIWHGSGTWRPLFPRYGPLLS